MDSSFGLDYIFEFLLVYRELNSNIFVSQVPCHKMKNCKNGGKTIIYLKDGPGSDPYRCECPKGVSGDLCQTGQGKLLKKILAAQNRMRIKSCCNKNSYQAMLKMFTHVRSGAATST